MAADGLLVWALLDDRAGNRAQAEGVARKLTDDFIAVEIDYGVAASLPNALIGASLMGMKPQSRIALRPPWPDLVIAAGRRTGPVARWIKHQSGGQTHLVQIMDPGAARHDFDLICKPAHDKGDKDGANVVIIDAAPHRLNESVLETAKNDWAERVAPYPAPRIALLIGGSTKRRTFTDAMAAGLCGKVLESATAKGASILATTSRRTGKVVETVAAVLIDRTLLYRWDQPGKNPYLGFLAHADAVVVTGESVSMCSEACSLGKPVYVFAPHDLIGAKHERLHRRLFDGGFARPFTGEIDFDWSPPTLDVAADIVSAIKARLL